MWSIAGWWAAVAFAGSPEVSTNSAGIVRARAIVSAPMSEVLTVVRDPVAAHALSGDEGVLTSRPDGTCLAISYQRSSMLGPIAYTARACPTATGIRSDLVKSESFTVLTSEWTVSETPAGTELSYTYHGELSISVPGFLLRKSTEAAITQMMTRMIAHFGAPPG